ncbi:MAG TPA: helix-turn-helix domain-containing protein [Micromonosporaceae bacterium]
MEGTEVLVAASDTPRHRALASASRASMLALVRASADGRTVAEVAQVTGLHPSTVRAHLEQLAEAGLVVREADRDGAPGRPAWRFRAGGSPEPGDSLYRDLAAALVGHLARTEQNPAAAGEQAGRDWGRRLARGDGGPAPAGSTGPAGGGEPIRTGRPAPAPGSPVDGLLAVLERLGFSPRVARRDRGSTVLHLRTCPFLELVRTDPDVVCGLHLGVIRGTLGGLGASTAGTSLEPFAAEGACVVRLARAAAAGVRS